jgi:hypothetical protein
MSRSRRKKNQGEFIGVSMQTIFILLISFVWVLPKTGFAQTQNDEPKKKHTLNFDDELIEGGVQKPELMYLLQRKNFNFKKLIRLREHFLPEMVETGELLRGSRSND